MKKRRKKAKGQERDKTVHQDIRQKNGEPRGPTPTDKDETREIENTRKEAQPKSYAADLTRSTVLATSSSTHCSCSWVNFGGV
jgi:hypothetical protein